MAKKNKYKLENDFTLLNPKVKTRIKDLIEKRLTSQTVMLFAQEYEASDVDFREELIDYINFLMEIEKEKWMKESSFLHGQQNVGSIGYLKQNEFYQKQEELKKFQEYLSKDRTANAQKDYWKSKSETSIKKPEKTEITKNNANKYAKVIEKNSIEKMLLEAKIREEKEAKEAKKIKEEHQRELDKQKELEKKKKEVVKKPKEKSPAKKVTVKQQPVIDRNYEKEQAEKERLWKELYGKTREETLNDRNIDKKTKENPVKYDKKPTFDSSNEIQKSFTILGNVFSINEITDPKNKYFSFWHNLKKRVKTSNILIWLSDNPNKQKSILAKRLRLKSNTGIWNKIKAFFGVKPKNESDIKEKAEKKVVKKETEKETTKKVESKEKNEVEVVKKDNEKK